MISHKLKQLPITNIKSISLLAMLSALSVAGRIVCAGIPNVQPMTDIVIITALVMGTRFGVLNAVLTIIASNLFLGMGIWTLPQIFSLTMVALLTGVCIRPLLKRIPLWLMSIYAGFTGLLYGLCISVVQAPIFGVDYLFQYYIAGLPFDLMHAAGNVVFYYVLAPILIPLLEKLLNKYLEDLSSCRN
ncbi:ECF transporter S component [Microbacteriaceae bacterium 4G12]